MTYKSLALFVAHADVGVLRVSCDPPAMSWLLIWVFNTLELVPKDGSVVVIPVPSSYTSYCRSAPLPAAAVPTYADIDNALRSWLVRFQYLLPVGFELSANCSHGIYQSIYFTVSEIETLKFISQEAKESPFNSMVTVVPEAVAFFTNHLLSVVPSDAVHLAKCPIR